MAPRKSTRQSVGRSAAPIKQEIIDLDTSSGSASSSRGVKRGRESSEEVEDELSVVEEAETTTGRRSKRIKAEPAETVVVTPRRRTVKPEVVITSRRTTIEVDDDSASSGSYGDVDTPAFTSETPATIGSDDEDDVPLAKGRARRAPARPSPLSGRARRTAAARITSLADDDDDDEDVDSDADSDFVPRDAGGLGSTASPVRSEWSGDEESEVEEEEEVAPRRAPRRAPRQTARNRFRGLSQYQKTMTKLLDHHGELADVWQRLEAEGVPTPQKAVQPDILTLKLLPFQLEGLHWLRRQEKSSYRGGILADEMGMGKTIQTVAMLCSDVSRTPGKDEAGTLVVAPTVAIMQWRNEINLYTGNALRILVYHGQNREISAAEMKKYDIVLTTYNIIESVWRKQQSGFKRRDGVVKEKSLLHSISFHRIVLDEAHNIKDRSTNTARAVFNLKADLRWCLSGTPLQNRVGELFSLLRFLEVEPFSNYFCMKCPCKSLHWKFSDRRHCDECGHKPMDHTCWFNHELLKPIVRFGATGEGLDAFRKIHLLLRRIMLRRTKVERADDMGLPPRVVTVRRDLFNAEEEDMYDSLYSDSKRKFDTYADAGTVLNNYANIFQLITRMRQMADHPDLILKRIGAETSGQTNLVCRICDDLSEDAIKARCHHTFCRSCVQDYIEGYVGGSPPCPSCRVALDIDLTAPALEPQAEEVQKRSNIVNRIDMSRWRTSTKIEALVEELYKLRRRDSSIKSIVFSQWTSFLELVHWRLRRAGFSSCKLDGTMTPEARAKTIDHFSTDPNVSVFLVSLKAGGVALNLTEASQVFILDPWWNPSAEWQAADRVHRLGQRRPVRITRLIVENSIESRIVELQEKKAQMIQATVSTDEAAMNRLTPEDMSFLFN